MRSFVLLVLALLPGCSANSNGGHSLAAVRRETAALRMRTWIDVERSLVFPDCTQRPNSGYHCGLVASRREEAAAEAACASQGPECKPSRFSALYTKLHERAEALDIDLNAVVSRCGAPCHDLGGLELEVIRTAGRLAEHRARAALLRADDSEHEATDRAHRDLAPVEAEKKKRDAKLEDILRRFHRDVSQAERELASLHPSVLCATSTECDANAECTHFPEAPLGLCQKP